MYILAYDFFLKSYVCTLEILKFMKFLLWTDYDGDINDMTDINDNLMKTIFIHWMKNDLRGHERSNFI